ncbi:MAG: phosphoribosyltransferase family protein [Flavobacteriaceae bacterium]
MTRSQNKIKSTEDIQRIIERIAHQVYENNLEQNTLVIAGIAPGGERLGKLLKEAISRISDLDLTFVTLYLDKANPKDSVKSSLTLEKLENQSIVVVDDVLNTGKTLIYAVHYFLQIPIKKINTVVMVNRNHKEFPVKADFKGISLSTSINEHVDVVLEGSKSGIYLS